MSFRTISVRLTGNASSLNSALYQASRSINNFGLGMTRSGAGSLLKFGAAATLAGSAAIALTRAFTASVRQAVAFDAAMRNVNSISGLSERQLHGLGQSVLDLSTQVPQSATTLANGLYQIASSGFQGAEGLTILKASAVAATAGLTDTATSAQVIVGALNAYGLGADQATKVSDELFQTVNVGVLTFNDLAQGMGEVTGAASAAKVPLSDVGAAIATMTRAGLVPAEAFTSLNRVIVSILQPSEALAGVFKQLGYESGASALQTKGLQGVMDDLRRVTGGSAESVFQLFTDIRGARGALALMTNQGRLYNDVSKQFQDANEINGRTVKTFNEQMKSVSAQWTLFKNRVSAVSIEAATHLLPAILQLIQSMTDLGHAAGHVFTDLAPFFTALRNVGADVVTVFREMLSVATPLAKAIAGLVGGVVIATLNTLGGIIATVTGALAKMHVAADALAIVLLTRMLPALSVIAWKALSTVIVGLDTALFGLGYRIEGAGGGLRGLGRALGGLISPATLAAAAIVGAAEAYSQFKQSSDQAKAAAKDLAAGFDILNPSSAASQDALNRMNATLDRTYDATHKGGVAAQALVGTLQVITPFTKNTTTNLADLNKQTNKLFDDLIAQSTAAATAVNSVAFDLKIPVLQDENGPAGLLAVLDQLAAKLNLGPALAAGGKVGEQAMARLKQAYIDLGKQSGTTTAALAANAGEDIDAMEAFAKAVQQAADTTKAAFAGATDVIQQFDPESAAKLVSSAHDELTAAQKRLKDETAQYNAQKDKSVSGDQQLRDARQGVADATKNLRDAQTEAAKTGDLATVYRNDIAMGRKFVTEIQTAIQKGLDPQLVARLLAAGPEQAGPILDQLVSDHSGRLIDLANSSEKTLSQISATAVRLAQFTATAINAPVARQAQLARDLPHAIALQTQLFATGGKEGAKALERELHLKDTEISRIAAEYGIVLPKAIQAQLDHHPVAVRVFVPKVHTTATGVTVSSTREQIRAAGGYITGPGTTTSDSIPAWLSNREYVQPARAVDYYGVPFMEAIRRLQLPRFAGGGQVSPMRRFADGGRVSGGSAPTIVRVVEQPATYITRHETNVGEVRPYDSREFLTWMEQQKRRKAYSP